MILKEARFKIDNQSEKYEPKVSKEVCEAACTCSSGILIKSNGHNRLSGLISLKLSVRLPASCGTGSESGEYFHSGLSNLVEDWVLRAVTGIPCEKTTG